MYFAIYVLFDKTGVPDYVGSTNNVKRRMKEHRKVLGFKPSYEIVEEGDHGRFEAEERWIDHYQRKGHWLRNKSTFIDGVQNASAATRALISQKTKGRVVSAEVRKRISAAQKGLAREWSEEGRIRLEATHFKKGHKSISEDKRRESIRQHWANLSRDAKSRILRETNLKAWAARSCEERSRIGQKIAKSRAKNNSQERLSNIARHAATVLNSDPAARKHVSNSMKSWWANMTPEYRVEYLARRAQKIREGKARAKRG